MSAENKVEFVPLEEAMLVAVHQPDGVTVMHEMTLEEFARLRTACEKLP